MVAFRAVDWTKCRHAQRMAALQCSSVALGVAQTLCLMALREIACTKRCHLQHFAALRRPSATCNSISWSRLHEMLLYATLGRSASPRRYATCNDMLCNRAFRTRANSLKHTHPLAPSTSTYCRATMCNHEDEFSNPTPSMNTFS